MSTDPVAPVTARRLLARLAHAQSDGRLPSVVAGVLRDGALAWSGTRGTAPVPGHDPLDVQYRIGSITKTLTAVVVLQLARDGRLDLDEPASKQRFPRCTAASTGSSATSASSTCARSPRRPG